MTEEQFLEELKKRSIERLAPTNPTRLHEYKFRRTTDSKTYFIRTTNELSYAELLLELDQKFQ